jgi:hypothetical protein
MSAARQTSHKPRNSASATSSWPWGSRDETTNFKTDSGKTRHTTGKRTAIDARVKAATDNARSEFRTLAVVRDSLGMRCLTPKLTGAEARSAKGTDIGHEHAEGMAHVGVHVERTVRQQDLCIRLMHVCLTLESCRRARPLPHEVRTLRTILSCPGLVLAGALLGLSIWQWSPGRSNTRQ